MPKQSTRHSYKSRREKNTETSRVVTILLWGAVALAVMMALYRWDDIAFYFKTLTMD